MPAKRIKLVGLSATLRAMRRWLRIRPGAPVRVEATRRRGAVVVRLEPIEN